MDFLDLSLKRPEENIALDEILLDLAENAGGRPFIRLWESYLYFVAIGKGERTEDAVYVDNCRKDKVKIIRRISGGGAVLLGKGCLNFSLILRYSDNPSFKDINLSYKEILGKICRGFAAGGLDLRFLPISDIVFGNKKVSGNAQARKKMFFLHHGTFLYDFDIDRVSRYIKHPLKIPEYRKNRVHEEFMANIPLGRLKIKDIIKSSVSPGSLNRARIDNLGKLIEEKINKRFKTEYSAGLS